MNAPAQGGVWIASKTEDAGGGSVLLRVALTHAHAGENGPKGRGAVGIDYRARLEGERAFDLVDGRVTRHELSIARRMVHGARSRLRDPRALEDRDERGWVGEVSPGGRGEIEP